MLSSKFSALSLFYTIVALSGIVRGEEVTRTLVAPAIGITSVSVLGVEGDETTFALYQTADDGATTFIQTMVADATNIVDVFPAPSFSCDFHDTATGKMQCVEVFGTSTGVTISVAVQTLLYAVDDASTVSPTSLPTPSGSPGTQSTNPATKATSVSAPSGSIVARQGYHLLHHCHHLTSSSFPSSAPSGSSASATSPNASQTSSAPSTTPSSGAFPAFAATYNKWVGILFAISSTRVLNAPAANDGIGSVHIFR
ncbi:hypothetical protein B0H11DRAFT_2023504 [Mycena galericulata]|nr:hypothetical protein B0H11DRAFT_2023504 [Mycena galericulata]